jgi:glutamate/tyrosine decarboxylase-like PLP-dependent enzyme
VSRESHLVWIKIAHQAGIGRSAARLVATDGWGRLDPAALTDTIATDRATGCVPFMIAATAGTTNAGMIDPLSDCAEIARAADVWYHVDAAWGGALIASQSHRAHLAGIDQADSVTIDAHKWFATTMGCGMFVTRWPTLLSTAFGTSASYMPSNVPNVDPYVTTAQWSRRFAGLRLFLSLAAAGWEGYGKHVEHALSLAESLKKQLIVRGWSVANASPVGVLCIVPPQPKAVRQIVNRVVASGKAWVSVAVLEGHEVVRACVTSGMTTADDVIALVVALEQAAADY